MPDSGSDGIAVWNPRTESGKRKRCVLSRDHSETPHRRGIFSTLLPALWQGYNRLFRRSSRTVESPPRHLTVIPRSHDRHPRDDRQRGQLRVQSPSRELFIRRWRHPRHTHRTDRLRKIHVALHERYIPDRGRHGFGRN